MAIRQNTDFDLNHAQTVALSALSWVLAEEARAERLLALTGLSPSSLRSAVEHPATLAAVLAFLEGHEPDLVSCAAALDQQPADLVRARTLLEASA
jgi:Protein of unknown function (DUF3572).